MNDTREWSRRCEGTATSAMLNVWESKVHEPVCDHGVWRTQEVSELYKMLCLVTDIERLLGQ